MAKKHEWKTTALKAIAPRLVIGAYRDVIGTIIGLETTFSIDEMLKSLKGGLEDFDELDSITLDVYRCTKIYPAIVDSLVEAGLLKKRDDGRFKKSDDFEDFWILTRKVRTSVERALRWGTYNIIVRKKGICSFSPDELVDVLTSSPQEIVEILNRIAVRRDGKWRKILQKNGNVWTILEKPERRSTQPSVVKDASQKIMYALSIL